MHKNQTKTEANQEGFAALVIAIVLVLVLSLITVGFAQLMRHEQTAALDKQLSSQAYYAAESGINDAVSAINAGFANTKSTCNGGVSATAPGANYLLNTNVGGSSSTTNASFTCLLIDPHPAILHYDDVGSSTTKVVELEGLDYNNPNIVKQINTLEISWRNASGTVAPSFVSGGCSNLPPASGSGSWPAKTGMLRLGLTPLVNGQINRPYLIDSTYTGFICPNNAGGASTPGVSSYSGNTGNAAGVMASGNCSTANTTAASESRNNTQDYCNVYITNLATAGADIFFLSMRSIYDQSAVTISAYDNAVGRPVNPATDKVLIAGAQVLIDSTGKAQNVLRRIQARIPANNEYDLPGTTAGTDICKLLQIQPAGITDTCDND